ncbi:response regulator [Paenibacillus hodogayensis]|uniref:Response regulator n=1 Tax=Paenibacillus hodogayensis TaxID=279208 RepID=A0ABV5W3E8_9BACL
MWKLIIAEDEPMVRRTIRQKIDWPGLGFEIVGEAENGEDALRLIREHSPDLVIADIVMPLVDGIELLKRTREEGQECRFLMLTCMSEFEYARQALEYGASAYVLKLSMDVETLQTALLKIRRELESRSEIRELQARTRMHAYEQLFPVLWDGMYYHNTPPEEREAAAARLRREVGYVWFGAFLDGSADFCVGEVRRRGFAGGEGRLVLTSFTASGVTTVFAFGSEPPRWNVPTVNDPGPHSYAAIYARPVAITDLPDVWAGLLRAADRVWYDDRRGLQYADIASESGSDTPALSWSYEKELLRQFEQSKTNACADTLARMWDEMRRLRYPLVLAKATMLRLDQVFARISALPPLPPGELTEAASFTAAITVFANRMSAYLERLALSEERMTDHEEVNKMIRYIRQHYDSPITLKSTALHVAMEEHYVSRLFKKKVGESLIHYLQQYRVDRAKVYLTETDMNVGDVGRSVGFASDNYFNKIFKRTTGLTPSEYRKRFGSNG